MGLEGKLSRAFMKPATVRLPSPAEVNLAFEDVRIEVASGLALHGWFLPSTESSGRTVLLLHGSQKDISYYFPYYSFLHDAGLNVFLYDYRGYGESGGEVSIGALVRDAEIVFDDLAGRSDVDPDQVAVYGISMGTIPALALAERRPQVAGVVVEDCASPDDNIAAYLKQSGRGAFSRYLFTCWLDLFVLPRGIEPDGNASRFAGPVFFLHGEHDFDIDVRATLRAHRKRKGPGQLWILPDTGHAPDSLQVHDGEYQAAVLAFLDDAWAGQPPPIACEWEVADGDVHVTLSRRAGSGEQAIELCVCLESGVSVYERVWLDRERADYHLTVVGEVVTVGAMPYRLAERNGETWRRLETPYSRARLLRGVIESRYAEMMNSTDVDATTRFAAWVDTLGDGSHLDSRLEAELTNIWLELGKRLAEEHPAEARRWLQRAIDSEPEHPGFHFWMEGGTSVRMGWHGDAAVNAARQLLEGSSESADSR